MNGVAYVLPALINRFTMILHYTKTLSKFGYITIPLASLNSDLGAQTYNLSPAVRDIILISELLSSSMIYS